MRRYLTIPHEPLARFRLLSVWFAGMVALLNVGLFALVSHAPSDVRWQAATCAALLGFWWVYGFRHGGFPLIGWLIDACLIVVVSAVSPMPSDAVGLFFAGIQFRALYVPRRQIGLLVASYGVARLASIALAHNTLPYGPFSPTAIVSVLGLTIIAVTVHLFVTATERHAEIKRDLERSDERYRLVASATRDVVYDWSVETGAVEWTQSMQHVFGFAPEQIGKFGSWWMNRVHPADRESLDRTLAAAIADPNTALGTVEYRVRRADESYAYVSGSMIVQRRPDGTAERVVGSIRDVTTEHLLEEQLRQAQKMEAVGQLAGGVAHDFNNLLTVIGGHVFMLDVRPRANTARRQAPRRDHARGRSRSGAHEADARLQPQAAPHAVGARPQRRRRRDAGDDAARCSASIFTWSRGSIRISLRSYADAGQLGQVIVNLALNARDAMPNGGTLTIETTTIELEARRDDATATAPSSRRATTCGSRCAIPAREWIRTR